MPIFTEPGHTISELRIPDSMDHIDDPDVRAFAEMVTVRNAIEADILGSDDLMVSAVELLPTYQVSEFDPRRLFVARVGGKVVARAISSWSTSPDARATWVCAEVLREFRGRGIGSALFEMLEDQARQAGRPVTQCEAVHTSVAGGERLQSPTGFGDLPASDDGVRFLRKRGYRLEQIVRISFLALPVDPQVLAARRDGAQRAAGPDYRIVRWRGRTPSRWLADLALLKTRMSLEEPSAGLDVVEEIWDEARVMAHDETFVAGGRELITAAAEHVPSGHLVGLNEVEIPRDRCRPVSTGDTLVLAEHRGHRLGMLMKAANLEFLAQVNPASTLVGTFNAEENRPMLDVNEAVGFRPAAYQGVWKKVP